MIHLVIESLNRLISVEEIEKAKKKLSNMNIEFYQTFKDWYPNASSLFQGVKRKGKYFLF